MLVASHLLLRALLAHMDHIFTPTLGQSFRYLHLPPRPLRVRARSCPRKIDRNASKLHKQFTTCALACAFFARCRLVCPCVSCAIHFPFPVAACKREWSTHASMRKTDHAKHRTRKTLAAHLHALIPVSKDHVATNIHIFARNS